MEVSINQLLALEYVRNHSTEDMTPEQIAKMYDVAYAAICHRNDVK